MSEGAGGFQTAVVVPVPAAEAVVGDWRGRFDAAASWGVPAHVTVLFPFLPPEELTDAVLDELASAVGEVEAFDARFDGTAWFGEEVLWLRPEPADAFRALTHAVWRRFPQCPPYGGAHPDVTPHLTVGHGDDAAAMRAAERELTPSLPIRTRVEHVWLLTGPTGAPPWSPVREFPLRSRRAG